MADLDFYNENEHRSYPLKGACSIAGVAMPKGILVDAFFVFKGNSSYDIDSDYVYLYSVSRNAGGTQYTLRFRAAGEDIDVVVPAASEFGEVIELPSLDFVFGWVMPGTITDLDTIVVAGTTEVVTSVETNGSHVENSRIQSLVGTVVTTLNFCQEEATAWIPFSVSGGSEAGSSEAGSSEAGSSVSPNDTYSVVSSGLVGLITFVNGFNLEVILSDVDNSITLSSGVGIGEGEPCNWEFEDDMQRCSDLIATINGVVASDSGRFFLNGERGLLISATGAHELTIGLGNVDLYCGEE